MRYTLLYFLIFFKKMDQIEKLWTTRKSEIVSVLKRETAIR